MWIHWKQYAKQSEQLEQRSCMCKCLWASEEQQGGLEGWRERSAVSKKHEVTLPERSWTQRAPTLQRLVRNDSNNHCQVLSTGWTSCASVNWFMLATAFLIGCKV